MTTTRIDAKFAALKDAGRSALVTFVTAGDPDYATSLEIVKGLPAAGADIIELGMPFTDPMADGPAIQAASLRALKAGQTMVRTLEMVRAFRAGDWPPADERRLPRGRGRHRERVDGVRRDSAGRARAMHRGR